MEIDLIERDGRTHVVRDGVEVPLDFVPVGPTGTYSLLLGTESRRIVVAGPNDDLLLTIASEVWKASVVDEREELLKSILGDKGAGAHGGTVKAVMPGIVRDVRVAKGDTVKKGQALLILEAMKMQNEVRADADGVVSEVRVAVGTAVAKGDVLVTLE
ncbi:MAG: biotin/lipoyl-binding protein [Planctomycetes bacterium]|nr:biotin/lipoyl-binding protein [Planctomycetota bacterium]